MGKMPSPDVPDSGYGQPITAELLELCMDRVAQAIVKDEKRGAAYLPIYERLSSELAAMRRQAQAMDEIRERVRRLPGRN
jgi:hypothetical protein